MYGDKTKSVGRAMFMIDVLVTSIIFILCIWSRKHFFKEEYFEMYSHMAILPVLLFFVTGFLSYFGVYQRPYRTTIMDYLWSIFRAIILSVGALLTTLFIFNIEYVSRIVIMGFAIIEFIAIFLERLVLKRYLFAANRDGKNTSRVLVIGTGERAKELSVNLCEQPDVNIEVIGYLDPDRSRLGSTILGAPVIGTLDDIYTVLKSNVVDEVIIGIPRSMLSDAEPIAHACEVEGIKLRIMVDLFNLEVARTKLINLSSIPLLTLEPVAQDEIKLMVKRAFDLVVTIVAMPILIPLLAIIAITIKIDSPGPVFFIQQRVGLKKRLFPLLKLRTMRVDAEEKLKEIEHLNEAEGPIFKMKNDPRVTNIGRILRKTSLDELPQLFNVLRGEMSLVGPRPMSIRDVDLFDEGIQRKRFSVKPGITCLWQISGRSNLPFTKWLELDLKYIENWSLYLDLKIFFLTIPAVLKNKGAV